jgi:hypothetical protein
MPGMQGAVVLDDSAALREGRAAHALATGP